MKRIITIILITLACLNLFAPEIKFEPNFDEFQKPHLVLKRIIQDNKKTAGELYIYNHGYVVAKFSTIECPDSNNEKFKSCIPAGRYKCIRRAKNWKYDYPYYEIQNVKNRDYIYIHIGKYPWHVEGCIGVSLECINFLKSLPDEITIFI